MRLSVFTSELKNVLRSRWLYAFSALLAFCSLCFFLLSKDPRKTQLALINVVIAVVPLVSVLFTNAYWYNSETFTELLLSQPVSRRRLFWSRSAAILPSLGVSLFLGLILPFLCLGAWDGGLIWIFSAAILLASIFSFLGVLIASLIRDRMWGIGMSLGIWCYWMILHDAFILFVLYTFRDYPLEKVSAILCALNPLGLVRVGLLMHFDAPILLGHAGAFIRQLVETGAGYYYGLVFCVLWILIPAFIASRKFSKSDF